MIMQRLYARISPVFYLSLSCSVSVGRGGPALLEGITLSMDLYDRLNVGRKVDPYWQY